MPRHSKALNRDALLFFFFTFWILLDLCYGYRQIVMDKVAESFITVTDSVTLWPIGLKAHTKQFSFMSK